MGIRDRLKKRVKGVQGLLRQVHEEANYPGRPQPHMAARNPMWGGEADKPPAGVVPKERVPAPVDPGTDPYAANPDADAATDDYWFLKGDTVQEGWQDTNPGEPTDENGED